MAMKRYLRAGTCLLCQGLLIISHYCANIRVDGWIGQVCVSSTYDQAGGAARNKDLANPRISRFRRRFYLSGQPGRI
jgi:hypothetical protein